MNLINDVIAAGEKIAIDDRMPLEGVTQIFDLVNEIKGDLEIQSYTLDIDEEEGVIFVTIYLNAIIKKSVDLTYAYVDKLVNMNLDGIPVNVTFFGRNS